MSRYYDKDELKGKLELEQIYDLLELWGGEPEYINNGLIAKTICHGGDSHKLYYYNNSKLAVCYSGCVEQSFDIFELCIKVKKQEGIKWELYDAMDYIASYFGYSGTAGPVLEEAKLEDWNIFKRHEKSAMTVLPRITLNSYDPSILRRFAYPRIGSWEKEGISADTCRRNLIGYYPAGEQITIPHFDINNRLIGIRGRALGEEEGQRYGKYRPIKIGNTLYSHPLSMNLYNLNSSCKNIKAASAAIIFESEKSCMLMQEYYGIDNDISVACCGSNISSYHIQALIEAGAREVIIAFDRQFMEIDDDEHRKLVAKLLHITKRYGSKIRVSLIFDKHCLTPYKSSPIDCGKEIFETLLKARFTP